MTFASRVCDLGPVDLPPFRGIRVLLMPFHLHDPVGTMPPALAEWAGAVESLVERAPHREGTGYLTVDEVLVEAGTTHRRPGIHVDGVGPDDDLHRSFGGMAIWGPSSWAPPGEGEFAGGMVVASSHMGCRAWNQEFAGYPGPDGECAHLAEQCDPAHEVPMMAGRAYWCGGLAVHEPLPLPVETRRQFVRISMPSGLPWYEGCTTNPLGIMPDGPLAPRRTAQLAYRA